jgi:hypothetical protein
MGKILKDIFDTVKIRVRELRDNNFSYDIQ